MVLDAQYLEILIKMKKVLVIQTAFPGDAILTLPLIQTIKKTTEVSIDVLAIPSTADIFASSKYVNSVRVYDKRKRDKSLYSFIKLAREIKKNKYDVVYCPHRSARSILISFLSGAKERIGFDKAALNFLLTMKVKYEPNSHEVYRNLSLLEHYDLTEWKVLPEVENRELPEEIAQPK